MTWVWELDTEVLSDKWETYTEEVKDRAVLLATSSLQTLTYGRVGLPPKTIRPIPPTHRCGCGFNPHMGVNGRWYNNCFHRSGLLSPSEIDIPGPVGFIDRLVINGVVQDLDPDEVTGQSDWRLDNGHLLVWQGLGPSPIPAMQDLRLPDTEPGTYSITYSPSYPVSADAKIAVSFLAEEFAKALNPKTTCSLPKGVTSVVRNGVSFSIEAGLFPNGLTGIQAADQFILKWAPAGAPTSSAVVVDPRKTAARVTNAVPRRPGAPRPGFDNRGFGS